MMGTLLPLLFAGSGAALALASECGTRRAPWPQPPSEGSPDEPRTVSKAALTADFADHDGALAMIQTEVSAQKHHATMLAPGRHTLARSGPPSDVERSLLNGNVATAAVVSILVVLLGGMFSAHRYVLAMSQNRKKSDRQSLASRLFGVFALVMFVGDLVVGYVFEGWWPLTSTYVFAQMVTTIGYGDITPRTGPMRVWTLVMILLVLVVLAHFINDLLEHCCVREEEFMRQVLENKLYGDAHEQALDKVQRSRQKRIMLHLQVSGASFLGLVMFGTVFYAFAEGCSCSYGLTRVEGCDDTSRATCSQTGGRVKSWMDALYFSVVTLTTVGFGDFNMVSWWGRLVGVFWMLFGVASAASFLTAVSTWLFDVGQREKKAQVMGDIVRQLDSDGDGRLSKAEHHLVFLVKHGVVDAKTLAKLDEHYKMLDPGNHGSVDCRHLGEKADDPMEDDAAK